MDHAVGIGSCSASIFVCRGRHHLPLWPKLSVRAFFRSAVFPLSPALLPWRKLEVKVIWHYPTKWKFRWCWTGWKFKDYDTNLDHQVCFARQAMAIDETRADFARVPWGQPSEGPRPEVEGVESFVQLWFAGDHSDIGGSYPEDESRLSDITLSWMVEQVEGLPHPVKLDRAKLHMWPNAAGMQHSEVESVRDSYPSGCLVRYGSHGVRNLG